MTISGGPWTDGSGRILVDPATGAPLACATCPCTRSARCSVCPDTPVTRVYWWSAWFQDFSTGPCVTSNCTQFTNPGGSAKVYFYAKYAGSFLYALPGVTSFIYDDPDSCLRFKIVVDCDPGSLDPPIAPSLTVNYGVDYGNGFTNQIFWGAGNPDDGCFWHNKCFSQGGGSGDFQYFSTRDPRTGIETPTGIVPPYLNFSIVIGGVTYDSVLTFSCGSGVNAIGPGYPQTCLTWVGTFTDCNGNCSLIDLAYGDNGSGVKSWQLYYEWTNPGVGIHFEKLYDGTSFPFAGVSVDTNVCGDPGEWHLSGGGSDSLSLMPPDSPELSKEPGDTRETAWSPSPEQIAAFPALKEYNNSNVQASTGKGCCGSSSNKSPLRVVRKPKT